jgi:hypothetical protein
MTRHELRNQLVVILADLYATQHMLEHAVRAGVPPDIRHVVQLDLVAKQLCSILAKLDEQEPTVLEESA